MVNTLATQLWLRCLNNSNPIKIPNLFLRQGTRFEFTPTKRRLSISLLPILQPLLKPILPSYAIYSISFPPSHP